MTHTGRKARIARRSGAVLVAAVIAFGVVTAILFTVLQSAISHQRQFRSHLQNVQAGWLAQAGLDRAVAELRLSAAYRAETWRPEPTELDGEEPAEVQIRVEPSAARPAEFHIRVQADYPSNSELRARQSREATIALTSAEK